MIAKTNSAGTLANVFSIGKGGPTIRQGNALPAAGLGNDGDVYFRYGTPGAYLKAGGAWQTLTPNALPLSGGTLTGALTITSTITHNGLIPTVGLAIDQIVQRTLTTITLSPTWQDTAIRSTDLSTGTYVVQAMVTDDAAGGTQTSEYYSGVMSWYSSDTNETTTDEIVLHRAGVKNGGNAIFLRVQRTPTANTNDLYLQIAASNTDTSPANVQFKFRRIL